MGTLQRASAWFGVDGGTGVNGGTTPRLRVETPADQGEQGIAAVQGEWQQAQVPFRVPSPGRIRVRLVA